ncbi:hypothetical protein GCM10025868_04840 [Angustibacter aerolatus]|uniref:AB hydrolase-1 domain-containing protein n=1 Tax=Angustibacter aerolatus TaxID=1162965 RepID=A0ABQ6JDI9_9ACTN|nr:hypothetical protein GCM10025868_04840 [Angustibacter aerolatus]
MRVPALVLQCRHDALAPEPVGRMVAATLPNATLRRLEATGHCPHVASPAEVAAAVREHLDDLRGTA